MQIRNVERKKVLREKPKTYVTSSEKVYEDGVFKTILKKVPLEDVDARSEFKASDYSIDALLAAGAVDLLKEVGTLGTSTFDNIERIESLVSSLPSLDEIDTFLSSSKENNITKEEEKVNE